MTNNGYVTALVADDEPLARQRIRDLLEDEPWIECIGEAADGPAAVRSINELRPEVVFLDIQMPGMLGLDVLREVESNPHVIFTTAFAQYAVVAFELCALDYLLKPFAPERFRQALTRVRAALGSPDRSDLDRVRAAFADGPISRLFIRERGAIVTVTTSSIERLEARGDYVAVFAGDDRYLVHLTMGKLEARLDPAQFVRVHRAHIVNLNFVKRFTPYDSTRLQVALHDGTTVIASRSRSRELRTFVT